MIPRENISEELFTLSQPVANIPRRPVFTVPEHYFDELPEKIMALIRAGEPGSAREETASISAVLGRIDRKMPFSVPDGYFDKLEGDILAAGKAEVRPAPVVSLFGSANRWKLAAAAVITGFIAISAWFFMKERSIESAAYSVNIRGELPKLSDEEINDFLVAFPETDETETAPTAVLENLDVESMLKDMKDGELQQFISDKPDLRTESLN